MIRHRLSLTTTPHPSSATQGRLLTRLLRWKELPSRESSRATQVPVVPRKRWAEHPGHPIQATLHFSARLTVAPNLAANHYAPEHCP